MLFLSGIEAVIAAKFSPEIDEEIRALIFGEAPTTEVPVSVFYLYLYLSF